jgi:hypothetical protein
MNYYILADASIPKPLCHTESMLGKMIESLVSDLRSLVDGAHAKEVADLSDMDKLSLCHLECTPITVYLDEGKIKFRVAPGVVFDRVDGHTFAKIS